MPFTAAFSSAAAVVQVVASVLSPRTVASSAPVTKVWWSSELAAMFLPPWLPRAQSLAPRTISSPSASTWARM